MIIVTIAALLMVTYTSSADRCKEGYYGKECQYECNDKCGGENNNCDSETGDCTAGCDSGYYGKQCKSPCFKCANGVDCDVITGHCPDGCEPGWYRPKCNSNCDPAENILNCWLCNKKNETTECLLCDKGFFMPEDSDQCMPCSANCVDSNCEPLTGHCKDGCVSGYTLGIHQNCSEPCSENCVGNECRWFDGRCTHDCENRTYGLDCSKKCIGMCVNNTCERSYGYCRHECETGYMGEKCDYTCDRCVDEMCDPVKRKCIGECKPHWYGRYCEKRCSGCVDEYCLPGKGCINGCVPGKRRYYCTRDCPDKNCFACEQRYGACQVCKTGFTGPKCDVICENCTNPDDNATLSYHGNCDQGYFGALCDRRCSETCNAINAKSMGRCHKFTGICRDGCEAGFYGQFCSNQCGNCSNNVCEFGSGECYSGCSTGYFGKECNKQCPANCKDQICYQLTGGCTHGCEENYEGSQCANKSTPFKFFSTAELVGIVVGPIIGFSIIVTAIRLYCEHRRKKAKREKAQGVYFKTKSNISS